MYIYSILFCSVLSYPICISISIGMHGIKVVPPSPLTPGLRSLSENLFTTCTSSPLVSDSFSASTYLLICIHISSLHNKPVPVGMKSNLNKRKEKVGAASAELKSNQPSFADVENSTSFLGMPVSYCEVIMF